MRLGCGREIILLAVCLVSGQAVADGGCPIKVARHGIDRRVFFRKAAAVSVPIAVGATITYWLQRLPPTRIIFLPDVHRTQSSRNNAAFVRGFSHSRTAFGLLENDLIAFSEKDLRRQNWCGLEDGLTRFFATTAMAHAYARHTLAVSDPKTREALLLELTELAVAPPSRNFWPRVRAKLRSEFPGRVAPILFEAFDEGQLDGSAQRMLQSQVRLGLLPEGMSLLTETYLRVLIETTDRGGRIDTELARQLIETANSQLPEQMHRIQNAYVIEARDRAMAQNIAAGYLLARERGKDLYVYLGAAHLPGVLRYLRGGFPAEAFAQKPNPEVLDWLESEDYPEIESTLDALPAVTP